MEVLYGGHLQFSTAIIAHLETARGTTANTSNIKLLVDLVV